MNECDRLSLQAQITLFSKIRISVYNLAFTTRNEFNWIQTFTCRIGSPDGSVLEESLSGSIK